jgi:hypothetical protein
VILCGGCSADRSDEDLVDRSDNGVTPCTVCGSKDLSYVTDPPPDVAPLPDDVAEVLAADDRVALIGVPDPMPLQRADGDQGWDTDGLVVEGTERCPRCGRGHVVFGVASRPGYPSPHDRSGDQPGDGREAAAGADL